MPRIQPAVGKVYNWCYHHIPNPLFGVDVPFLRLLEHPWLRACRHRASCGSSADPGAASSRWQADRGLQRPQPMLLLGTPLISSRASCPMFRGCSRSQQGSPSPGSPSFSGRVCPKSFPWYVSYRQHSISEFVSKETGVGYCIKQCQNNKNNIAMMIWIIIKTLKNFIKVAIWLLSFTFLGIQCVYGEWGWAHSQIHDHFLIQFSDDGLDTPEEILFSSLFPLKCQQNSNTCNNLVELINTTGKIEDSWSS